MGGAFLVSAAQSAFQNTLLKSLVENAQSVTPQDVLFTGATELRESFSAEQLPGILTSYLNGIKVTFTMATVFAGAAFITSLASKWTNLKSRTRSSTT